MPRYLFTTRGAGRIDGRDFPQSHFLNLSNASCPEPEVTRGTEDLLSPDARHTVCGVVVYAGSQRAKAALALICQAALATLDTSRPGTGWELAAGLGSCPFRQTDRKESRPRCQS